MKHALKASFLVIVCAVLLANLHSHAREHPVPHPHVVRVSLAKAVVVTQPQMPVGPATVAVLVAAHLIVICFVVTPGTVDLFQTGPSFCRLRGPPLVCSRYQR